MNSSTRSCAVERVFSTVDIFRHIIEFIEDKENESSSYPILILALTFKTMLVLVENKKTHYQLRTKTTQFVHSVSLLNWVVDEGKSIFSSSQVHVAASRMGSLDVISWLDNQAPNRWTTDCFAEAARYGRLATLEKLDSGLNVPCPVDHRACSAAAKSGNLDIFVWLVEHNKPLKSDSFHQAALHNHQHIIEWGLNIPHIRRVVLTSGTFSNAAYGGHLDLLKLLVSLPDKPIDWNTNICVSAARNGYLHILKYARGLIPSCPWNHKVCAVAALGGHLSMLEWIRAQPIPCPWDISACTQAAFGEHLNVLKYLRSMPDPCPWSHETCCAAAAVGNLDILQWLRAQDPPCPWTYTTYAAAAMNKHHDVLEWLNTASPACPKTPSFSQNDPLNLHV